MEKKIIQQLRDEGLFSGTWQSPFATFTFSNTKKTDESGQPMVRVRVGEKDGRRRQTLYYPEDMVLNYMVLKSKIVKVN